MDYRKKKSYMNGVLIWILQIQLFEIRNVMKKHQFSYKNLHARPESAGRIQPIQTKGTAIQNKIDKISKQIQIINSRKQLKQFYSQKENDSRTINRLSTQGHDQLRPRRQFKLYTQPSTQQPPNHNHNHNHNHHPSNPLLQSKIDRLQLQLRRKLCDNGFLAFFKTSNSSSSMSHLDIYLKLSELQEILNEKENQVKDLQGRLSDCHREIEQLLMQREEAEEKFLEHTQEVREFMGVIDRLQEKLGRQEGDGRKYEELAKKNEEVTQTLSEVKGLLEEVQKQRVSAMKRIKELEEELSMERKKIGKTAEQARLKYQNQSSNLKKSLSSLTEELNKANQKCKELSEQNIELRNQNENLNSHIQNLTTDIEQQTRKTNEFQDEIERIKSDSKDQQEYNNQLQAKVDDLRSKLQTQTQKKSQYKLMVSQHLSKEKKYEEKVSNLKQQLKKVETHLTSALKKSQESIQKLTTQNEKLIESLKTSQSEITKLNKFLQQSLEQKKKFQDIIAEQEANIIRQSQLVHKFQSQKEQNSVKIQSLQQKKQITDRYKTVGKIKQLAARLKLYLPENINIATTKENEQLDKEISHLSSIIGFLISDCIQPLKKQVQALTLNIKTFELEKECFQDCKSMQIQSKQQALQILLKFVPQQSLKCVQEYISTLDQFSDCRTQVINKRVCLLEAVLKEAEKAKVRQHEDYSRQIETSRQIQTSRRSSQVKDLKRQKPINRDVLRKYFVDS